MVLFVIVMLSVAYSRAQGPPANNQKAGELSYELKNETNPDGSPNVYYRFILKMVIDCSELSPGLNPLIIHDITNNKVMAAEWTFDSASNKVNVIDPCIVFPSPPCYRVYYYHSDQALSFTRGGYVVFYGDCCRNGYQNLRTTFNASSMEGAALGLSWSPLDDTRPGGSTIYNSIAYIINIPSRFKYLFNSSPVFNSNSDTVLYVCTNQNFSHTFAATDPDGDSLAYNFTTSKIFAAEGINQQVVVHTSSVQDATYAGPIYTPAQPLGEGVDIDTKTGLVSGRLRDTGSYMLTVAVDEYRNGQKVTLTPHTRDIVIKVYDCSVLPQPQAIIPSVINFCNSTTVRLPNESIPYQPNVTWDNLQYLWDLGDGDTAKTRYPIHTYDTGAYNIRLITMPGYRCADTAYSKLLVYPTVKASFTYDGFCVRQPVKFTNTSTTDIGSINSTAWKFINLKDSTTATTAVSNPFYTFTAPDQTYAAILSITTTKGCEARDTQLIDIRQSPYRLTTHDTILSTGQPLQLHADGGYTTNTDKFIWSPAAGLDDPFSADPIAVATSPQDITYKVQMDNLFHCTLTDTIHVKYYKGPDIYLPAAFTPNGDGINDVFRPLPVGMQKLEFFRVFDRWGKQVYQTQTYLAGWDGSSNGRLASQGTYIWEVRGKDFNNKTIFKKGTVLLLR